MYHICFVYIYLLKGYRELDSFEEPWFTLVATITSLARELNPTRVGEHIYTTKQSLYIIYIYIHIYIYTELFSVARHERCFKLWSKPALLYVSRVSCFRAIVFLWVSEGVFLNVLSFLHILYRLPGELKSWEELLRFSLYGSGQIPH